jgi:hypothetical protein
MFSSIHPGWIAVFKDTEENILGFHEIPKKGGE